MNGSVAIIKKLIIATCRKNMKKKYTAISLFAGVGGLSYGFAQDDDFEIIAANEILGSMADAYSRNHPSCQ